MAVAPIKLSGKRSGARSSNETVSARAVPGCIDRADELRLDHIWRGSLLAAIGWSPAAINDPVNLQLLCSMHHADKTSHEVQLLVADRRDGGS